MSTIELVVFDMDGTIVDSMPMLENVAVTCIVHLMTCPDTKLATEMYRSTTGIPFKEQLEKLFPDDARVAETAEYYERKHARFASLPPLAKDIAYFTRYSGPAMCALISSTRRDIVLNMKQVQQCDFDFIGGFEEGRPKTVQLRDAMKTLGVTPDQTLYVGDSDSDALVARELAVDFIQVTVNTVVEQVINRLGV